MAFTEREMRSMQMETQRNVAVCDDICALPMTPYLNIGSDGKSSGGINFRVDI